MHPELTHAEWAGPPVAVNHAAASAEEAAAPERQGPGLPVLPVLPVLLAQAGVGRRRHPSKSGSPVHAPAALPAPAFVEGLGRWLGWKEAIALSSVLAQPPEPPSMASPMPPALSGAGGLAALELEFTRVRQALHGAMAQALDEAERAHDGSFPPWRRCCHQLQQQFEAGAAALRARARGVLRQQAPAAGGAAPGLPRRPAGPHLGELAALDAALAQALAAREQAQLALLSVLLEPQFQRQKDDAPAFRRTLQPLLQADLELRLQPALGLLDALRAAHAGAPTR